jgi:hypothetical protein
LIAIPALVTVVSNVVWMRRFTDDITNWAGREFGAGSALNGIHSGASVGEDCPLATVHLNRLPLEVFDDLGAVDDRCIVNDEVAPAAEMIVEAVDITERKE